MAGPRRCTRVAAKGSTNPGTKRKESRCSSITRPYVQSPSPSRQRNRTKSGQCVTLWQTTHAQGILPFPHCASGSLRPHLALAYALQAHSKQMEPGHWSRRLLQLKLNRSVGMGSAGAGARTVIKTPHAPQLTSSDPVQLPFAPESCETEKTMPIMDQRCIKTAIEVLVNLFPSGGTPLTSGGSLHPQHILDQNGGRSRDLAGVGSPPMGGFLVLLRTR